MVFVESQLAPLGIPSPIQRTPKRLFLPRPAQDVGLADENELLTVQIDFCRSIFLVEDLIARFEDRGLEDLFLFPFGFTSPLLFRCLPAPLSHGQDPSFYRFLLSRVGDDQPPPRFFPGLPPVG